ncbi:MAG: hypothetical protein R3Y51_05545 [Rikenellaceae bacterium]
MNKFTISSSSKKIIVTVLFSLVSFMSYAQFHMSANIQTNRLWRGGEVGDGVVITYDANYVPFGENFSVGVWGGTNLQGSYREFNFIAKYKVGGFTATLADIYNYSDNSSHNHDKFFDYNPSETGRFLDAKLSYQFGEKFPLQVSWSTIVFGRDRNIENTQNIYSTYCSLEYPIYNKDVWKVDAKAGYAFALNNIDGEKANFYGEKADLVNVSIILTRNVDIKGYNIPISATTMFNPDSNKAFFQLSVQLFSF